MADGEESEMYCVICGKPNPSIKVPIHWRPCKIETTVVSLCNIEYLNKHSATRQEVEFSNNFKGEKSITPECYIYSDKYFACSVQHLYEFCDKTTDYSLTRSLPLFWRLYPDYLKLAMDAETEQLEDEH